MRFNPVAYGEYENKRVSVYLRDIRTSNKVLIFSKEGEILVKASTGFEHVEKIEPRDESYLKWKLSWESGVGIAGRGVVHEGRIRRTQLVWELSSCAA